MSAFSIPQPNETEDPNSKAWEEFACQPKPPHSAHRLGSSFSLSVEPRALPSGIEKALEAAFIFAKRQEALDFLAQHRWLVDLLFQAQAKLAEIFGAESPKLLDLYRDEEGSETLYCLLLAAGDPIPLSEGLGRFDEEWWLVHCGEARGLLNFDIESAA